MYTRRELATITGVREETVRFYVKKGVIPAPVGRTRGAYYTDAHVRAIREVIRTTKDDRVTLEDLAIRTGYKPAADTFADDADE